MSTVDKPIFNPDDHTYIMPDGRELISVTQLIKKHGLSPSFDNVPKRVLEAACVRGNKHHRYTKGYVQEAYGPFTSIELELMVNNDHVAGTIDALFTVVDLEILSDLKTGQYYEESCRWQLSLYEYLLGRQVDELSIMHLDKEGNLTKHDLTGKRIPREEIEKLIQCDKDGVTYTPPSYELTKANKKRAKELADEKYKLKMLKKEVNAREVIITNIEAQIMLEMTENHVESLQTPWLNITYVPKTSRYIFYPSKLREAEPETYAKFTKEIVRPEHLKTTLKDNIEEEEITNDKL